MKAVHAKRLLRLADFLRALPEERFAFNQWVGDDWKGKPDLSCGTTACALGWAAAMPEFQDLGLRLIHHGRNGNGHRIGLRGVRGSNQLDAAKHVFGVTAGEFHEIFVEGSSVAFERPILTDDVAERIENVVARHGYRVERCPTQALSRKKCDAP